MDPSSKPTPGIPRLSSSRIPLPSARGSSTSTVQLRASGSDPQAIKARCSVPTNGLGVETELDSSRGANETIDILCDAATLQPDPLREKRKPRPSLSDRTAETLSQIPPSPLSNRRKSSFFNTDMASPMRPPLRPASAMGNTSPKPSSPTHRPPMPHIPNLSAAKFDVLSPCARRSMAQPAKPRAGVPACKKAASPRKPTAVGSEQVQDHRSFGSTPTLPNIGRSQKKPSSSNAQLKPTPNIQQPVATVKSSNPIVRPKKARSVSTSTAASSDLHQFSRSSMQSSQPCSTDVNVRADQPSKVSKSSAALRDTIAKVKQEAAERKMSPGGVVSAPFRGTRPGIRSAESSLDLEGTDNILRQRVRTALCSGDLNVAAMGFKFVPTEIRRIYDDPSEAGVSWSECVDLSKFIAADNELEELGDDIFPDVSNSELEDVGLSEFNGQFRGLKTLDLHNNLLKELPLGLRRLQNLHALKLSGNKLDMTALDIICQIGPVLVELRISNNELSGLVSDGIKNLRNLQILDLHSNRITELPTCLQELLYLQTVNLAENKLSSVPSELLAHERLVELNVSRNRLSKILFPPHIRSMTALKVLDISHNLLEALTSAELVMSKLQTANLSGNRLRSLPDISGWAELLTLTASENVFSEIPRGLTDLPKLKVADLSNNNIKQLDERIANMEKLDAINLAGNPLRERKLLTMSTDELKADLRKRSMNMDSLREQELLLPTYHSRTGGVINLSLQSLSDSKLPAVKLECPVFDIRLHHNSLRVIPVSLLSSDVISTTLRNLNLSHNPMETIYVSSPLSLPQLKELCLASCSLKSLEGLTSYLCAPSMTTMNLSANHLSGTLPELRTYFPHLTTLVVADNRFNVLNFHSVRGLNTLDIRNNEIDYLEPRLGLLSGKEGLKSLEVAGNRFRVPRWDILEKGTEAVLRYLRGRLPLAELGDGAITGEDCDD